TLTIPVVFGNGCAVARGVNAVRRVAGALGGWARPAIALRRAALVGTQIASLVPQPAIGFRPGPAPFRPRPCPARSSPAFASGAAGRAGPAGTPGVRNPPGFPSFPDPDPVVAPPPREVNPIVAPPPREVKQEPIIPPAVPD